jgi:hypothetical protein
MTPNPMEQPWHGAASVQERRVTVATATSTKAAAASGRKNFIYSLIQFLKLFYRNIS